MEYYLPRVDSDFSISMWLRPITPGLLMYKRTLDGSFTPLNISLTFNAGFYQIQIEYAYQSTPTVRILYIVVYYRCIDIHVY